MADSPITDDVGVVSFEITAAGSKIADSYQVKSIHVKKELNKIPTARIVFFDGNPATQKFVISDSDDLKPGVEIEVKLGYKSTNESVFKGIIVKHGVSFTEFGEPQMEIVVKDKALKMTVGRKNAYFKEKLDSDIISSLVSDAGLTADATATTVTHPMVVQHYCSDWDFMLSRAELNGQVVIVDGGKVTTNAPQVSESAVLTVTYGADLLRFDAELNSDSQLSAAQGTSWDESTQAIVQNDGSNPTVNSQGNITSSTLADVLGVSSYGLQSVAKIDSDTLKAWADSQLQRSWLNKITGSATFQGSSKAIPGCVIEFAGVGDRFNGSAYISGVEHEVTDGNWITTVHMGISDSWHTEKRDIQSPDASGLLPGISGLMIGKVMKLDEDPDSEFRIQVKLPMMQDDSNGVWARLSNFYATSGAGTFFIPEVDDEVVVGFLNADPRFPVVLGSLYSSKLKPGSDTEGTDLALTADNYKKMFITKAQNKVEFDDENKVITITTPGPNKVVLDDKNQGITIQDQNENKMVMGTDGISIEDKNGNKIVMSSSGIEINSASDVKLVAAQNINGSATSNVEMTATSNATIKGLEVSITADTSLTAKGSASAEFSAGGNTTVKGAMVMIN